SIISSRPVLPAWTSTVSLQAQCFGVCRVFAKHAPMRLWKKSKAPHGLYCHAFNRGSNLYGYRDRPVINQADLHICTKHASFNNRMLLACFSNKVLIQRAASFRVSCGTKTGAIATPDVSCQR